LSSKPMSKWEENKAAEMEKVDEEESWNINFSDS
jgi:hypothetical protein